MPSILSTKFRPGSGRVGGDIDERLRPLYGLLCTSPSLFVIVFLVETTERFDVPDFSCVVFQIILAVHFNVRRQSQMSEILIEVLEANAKYSAEFTEKGKLAMPPARRFAILTCMDARLDTAKFAGLAEGDAHVIRNAGGRASDDAIRSLVISYKLLGTQEWFVIHHTNCGMETFTDEIMRGLLASSLKTSSVDAKGWHDSGPGPGSTEANYIDWLTIKDQAA